MTYSVDKMSSVTAERNKRKELCTVEASGNTTRHNTTC